MEKEIYEILNRNDYVRLTAKLKSRVEELAKRIREKMEELDIVNDANFPHGEIDINGIVVRIESVRSRNFGEYSFLAIKHKDEHYGNEEWYSLEDVGKDYYYVGDFTAEVVGASNIDALAFLNVARKLIEKLGNIEDERVNNLQIALKNTNLILQK